MRSSPLAYFLTWTTRGTWLHGDDRGSVHREHNQPGTPLVPPSVTRALQKEASLVAPALTLSPEQRLVVERAVRDHAAIRNWKILAMAVRTNHVHAVVQAVDRPPEEVVRQFKSWATRRLREAGMIAADRPVWTRHASTRYLWDQAGLDAAVRYVVEEQGKPARYRQGP